jgi:hypothetical protein
VSHDETSERRERTSHTLRGDGRHERDASGAEFRRRT